MLGPSFAVESGTMSDWKLRLFAMVGTAFIASVMPACAAPPTIDTSAKHAFAIDFNTGTVLLSKGGDERIPPASMSKMMTAYVVFEYLKKGQATMDDLLPVSEKAWVKHKTGESNMFVPLGARVKIEDLVRGMIIQSGNDACVVLAEGLAGSESAFVEQMNETAKRLGLTGTHYANVDGLPDPQEYTTPHDLGMLARHLIMDFPEHYGYEAEKDFTYNGIKQGNRNPLLYKNLGVDGLKTGHTEEAGYGLTVSAIRDGRRIIVVLAGMQTMKERSVESEKVLEWAYREFNDYRLVKAGDPIDDAPVWLGETTKVPATTAADVFVTLPRKARHDLKVTAVYDAPTKAPVTKGETVGKLVISAPDMDAIVVPLVATQPVAQLNPLGRVAAAAGYLLWGKR
jgi:serine-type D-Ala-D-Ala carboxypeptidase (penicillin-binding protein 5/6)